MIDHASVTVSDYDRSKAFYTKALAAIGYDLIMEVSAEKSPRGCRAIGFGEKGKPDFWIAEGTPAKPGVHVAIRVRSRELVEAFYRAGLEAGGQDYGAPGPRPYTEGYYAAFLLDFDGNNIEAVCFERS